LFTFCLYIKRKIITTTATRTKTRKQEAENITFNLTIIIFTFIFMPEAAQIPRPKKTNNIDTRRYSIQNEGVEK